MTTQGGTDRLDRIRTLYHWAATNQGVVENFTYDGAGRLASYSDNGFNDPTHPANLISGITYDPVGHMNAATFANGTTQSWA